MPPFHADLAYSGKSIGNVAVMPLKVTTKATGRG